MATPAQIAQLRLDIQQPENTAPWTDEVLDALIDELGPRIAAGHVWRSKAASVAHLVDISEGGSSRKMSDLHKNFLTIADGFAAADGTGAAEPTSRSRTRPIERP